MIICVITPTYLILLFNYWSDYLSNRLDTFNLLMQDSSANKNFFIFCPTEFRVRLRHGNPRFHWRAKRTLVLVLSRGLANSKPLAHTTFIRMSAHVITSVLVEHATLFNTSHTHRRTSCGRAGHHEYARMTTFQPRGIPRGQRTFNQFSDSLPLLRAFCRHATKHRNKRMIAGGSEA